MRDNWRIAKTDRHAVDALVSEIGISDMLARLLSARGYGNPEDARAFLHPLELTENDPYLLKDMDKAVKRIRSAIENGESVGIIGDYDVDGITATATLYKYFTSRGVNTVYHIPSRDGEGYGISTSTLDRMKDAGCTLVISVDCGISAIHEVGYANSIGLDMIITDHHECADELPAAVAVIDPKRSDDSYPFSGLAGVGVAYKLIRALGDCGELDEYKSFAALGTLADMMPVTGENRRLITDGMSYIRNGANLGLSQLMIKSGVVPARFNSFSVSFILAPRINAAGRMEEADTALKLLLETDEYTAGLIAEKLCTLNRSRQETETEIFAQAVAVIDGDASYQQDKILVIYSDNWHQGVIGIVAARISERFNKPAILITLANGTGKGSGRSVFGFSIHKAVSECSDLLTKFGGHEYAVGLGISPENVPEFRRRINAACDDIEIPKRPMLIDTELYSRELEIGIVESINTLEPFGEGNPHPLFAIKSVRLSYVRLVGEKHTKISFRRGAYSFDAIYYNITPGDVGLSAGSRADIVFTLSINEYNGQERLQIVIKDISESRELAEATERFERIRSSGSLDDPSDMPDFSDFECVYKKIAKLGTVEESADMLADMLGEPDITITTVKLLIILDVFAELSLLSISKKDESIRVSVIKNAEKTSLDRSEFLRSLKKDE